MTLTLDLTESPTCNLMAPLKQKHRPLLHLPKIPDALTKIWKTTRFSVQDP